MKLQILFVLIVLAHERLRIIRYNVTAHPTAQWTAQQIVEAFPFETAPQYLIRDRGHEQKLASGILFATPIAFRVIAIALAF